MVALGNLGPRRWVGLVVVAVFAGLGTATSSPDEEVTNSTAATTSAPPTQVGAFEQHLRVGQTYGDGEGAEFIAKAVYQSFEPDDDGIPNGVVAVVRPGTPERIAIMVRLGSEFEGLGDAPDMIDMITLTVDTMGVEQSAFVVALKLRNTYHVRTRDLGASWVELQGDAAVQALETALSAEAAEPNHITHYGELSRDDEVWVHELWEESDRAYADRYPIELAEGATLRASIHTMSEFSDPTLHILDPDGELVTETGDSDYHRVFGLLAIEAERAGTYTMLAHGEGPGVTGFYVVRAIVDTP